MLSRKKTSSSPSSAAGGSLPTAPGTYNVLNIDSTFNGPNQVQIVATVNRISGTSFYCNGGQSVNISVHSGKVTVQGSGIVMFNQSTTASLTMNITQQQ